MHLEVGHDVCHDIGHDVGHDDGDGVGHDDGDGDDDSKTKVFFASPDRHSPLYS